MANARKCDRCQTCFDPFCGTGEYMRFQNPVFQNAESLRAGKRTRYLYDNDTGDAYVDLCPACAKAFEKFMCFDIIDIDHDILERAFKQTWDANDGMYDKIGELTNKLAGGDTDGDK